MMPSYACQCFPFHGCYVAGGFRGVFLFDVVHTASIGRIMGTQPMCQRHAPRGRALLIFQNRSRLKRLRSKFAASFRSPSVRPPACAPTSAVSFRQKCCKEFAPTFDSEPRAGHLPPGSNQRHKPVGILFPVENAGSGNGLHGCNSGRWGEGRSGTHMEERRIGGC